MQIFSKLEDVLDFAISQEQAAQRFYNDLSKKVTDPAVQELYRTLAQQEKTHEQHLKGMKEAEGTLDDSDLQTVIKSGYLNTRNVPAGIPMKEAIGFALEKEKSAHMLYALLADLIENKELAKLFRMLAEEESKHAEYFKKQYDKYAGGDN